MEYRKKSTRRGAQSVPIGMSMICWKMSPAYSTNMLSIRNFNILMTNWEKCRIKTLIFFCDGTFKYVIWTKHHKFKIYLIWCTVNVTILEHLYLTLLFVVLLSLFWKSKNSCPSYQTQLKWNSLSMLSSTIYTNFPLINKNILLSWLSQNQKKVSNYKLGNRLLIGCGS